MGNSTDDTANLSTAKIFRRLIPITLVAVVAYAGLAFMADASAVSNSLAALSSRSIALALFFASLSFVFRFVRWQRYLRVLSISVPLGQSALIFVSGLGMSITPGKAGELLKSLMLRKITGSSFSTTVPLVLAERIMDLSALLVLGAIGAFGVPGALLTACAALGAAAALLIVLGSPRLSEWVVTTLSRFGPARRYTAAMAAARSSMASLFVVGEALPAIALSMCAWLVHGLALYYVANAFPGVALSFPHTILTNSAPLLAGALAMIPGGLGLTEASMTGALMAFGGEGATQPVATAITFAVRMTTLWWAVALGIAALVVWHWRQLREEQ